MDSNSDNPVLRYGMAFSSAAILVFVAFAFLEGTIRWLVLGLAVVEVVLTPKFLKWANEQDDD
ncbi:hypothetical protein [Halorussus litoreus]|uniref:hypothetical protein n=1 Tax=Halorussus litoreus TaxID=1710536 RepID=UPI000E284EA7|nr:hypothetical protein [Halorussus litoreus]